VPASQPYSARLRFTVDIWQTEVYSERMRCGRPHRFVGRCASCNVLRGMVHIRWTRVAYCPDVLTYADRQAAAAALPEIRRNVRRQAAAAARESYSLLYGCDALRCQRPSGSLRDFMHGLDPREVARLGAWFGTSAADSVDNVAMRLRAALPGLENLSDDDVMRRVWLHHTRIVDAAGAIARGRFPAMRRYSGSVDVAEFAPGVASDGYDVALVMGDDDGAVRHIATVDINREADDAYRTLGADRMAWSGPAPWAMTAESFEAEVMTLRAGLIGDDVLAISPDAARVRLDELVPKLIDDGSEWVTIHARIVELATIARITPTDRS
jgi:hypothetical protein